MRDDVYRDLPRELTGLLRDPRLVLPGELETMDLVQNWTQAPAFSNPSVAAVILLPSYVSAQPTRSLTGATSSTPE